MKKILTFLFVLSEINLHGQQCGPLDPTFGTAGMTFGYSVTGSDRLPYTPKLIVQPDNKIIQTSNVFTSSHYDFGLIRYKADGKLDSTFGTNGRVTTAVGVGESSALASALQSDGKIVSAGWALGTGSAAIALVRYHNTGRVDSSFGTNGRVITQIGASYDAANSIAIQHDGKILVAGSSYDTYYTNAFAILRYNSTGSLDSAFGQNGKIITHPGPLIDYIGNVYFGRYADEYASAVLAQSDGKIVVAGKTYSYSGCYDYYGGIYCNPALAVIRFNNNGTIDSSFGINGKIVDSVNLVYPSAAVLQNDGKIVVTGSGYNNGITTGRFKSNGSPDSSFGNNGVRILQISAGGSSWGASLTIQADEKIVVAGTTGFDFTVARYLVDGTLDNTFNQTGAVAIQIGQAGTYNQASSVGIQGNKIIVGGTNRQSNNGGSIVVVRVLENGQPFTPVINASGPLQFCNGNSVKLSVSDTGLVQWYRDNIALMSANDTSIVVSSGGWYKVRISNALGCAFSTPVAVSTSTPFTPTITANGPITFCIGDSTILFSNGYSDWYKNGVLINGSTGNNLIVKESGTYTAKTKYNGCESAASNAIVVAMNSSIPPTPVISAGSSTAFCGGQNVLLSSNATSGNQWYKDGLPVNGATAATFSATTAGMYTVKVSVGGCQSSISNSISTTVYPQPSKPIINWVTPDFSTASGFTHYQWYLNNILIVGVDTFVYRPTQTGTYKVVVTGNNNCTNTSDNFELRVLAIPEITIGDSKLRYYPNPLQSVLHIDINGNSYLDKFEAKVYDASGKLVLKQSLSQNQNQLAMQRLPMGFYQLVIHNRTGSVAVKLIKAR